MKISKSELNTMLENHALWLCNDRKGVRFVARDIDLSGAYLNRADLCWADLKGAYLYRADLNRAYLRGADLRGADLYRADLKGADLCWADLKGADLYRADLYRAYLYRADLRGANLYRADLRDCSGDGVEIITITSSPWSLVFYQDELTIGCEKYKIKEWLAFTDDEINRMSGSALAFWKKNKHFVVDFERNYRSEV